MLDIVQKERVDVYTIPPNFATEGTILSGRLRIRNAFEAGGLVFLCLQVLLSLDWGVRGKIYAGIIVILPVAIFALLGVQGDSLTSFIFQFIKYLMNRRILTVPDGKYRLKRKRRLRKRNRRRERKQGGAYNSKRSKRIKAETQGGEMGREAEAERRKEESERNVEG